jgi:hypothetical protein
MSLSYDAIVNFFKSVCTCLEMNKGAPNIRIIFKFVNVFDNERSCRRGSCFEPMDDAGRKSVSAN